MSVEILFQEDIKHILQAAERASQASATQAEALAANVESLRAYRRGFRAALTVVALACGLSPLAPQADEEILPWPAARR